MIRTHISPCRLPRPIADALNQESGQIYTRVMVTHYRAFRQSGVWLSNYGAQKLDDCYTVGQTRLLHAHSIDAAQEAFYTACKTAKANRDQGAHYPHQRKVWRTTVWKNTRIRQTGGTLVLALPRGRPPPPVTLPSHLANLPKEALAEMGLVWDQAGQ